MNDLERLINPGDRPSRLELGSLHSGELGPEDSAAVAESAAAHPSCQDHLLELEAARAEVPPFNAQNLRKAALRLMEQDSREQAQKKAPVEIEPWWRRLLRPRVALLATLAAAASLLIFWSIPSIDTGEHTIRTRGKPDVDFMVLRDEAVSPGDESALYRAGDRIQISYRSEGESSLVLLSMDGRGHLSLYYPTQGNEPLGIIPGERHMLPDSIELDDAPEFELFLAFFGANEVSTPRADTERVFENDGLEGLLRLAQDSPDIDAILIRKAP